MRTVEFFDTILKTNNLLPAGPEVHQIRQGLAKGDTLKPLEKQGVLKLRLVSETGDFFLELDFRVPEDYPESVPELMLGSTNFPQSLVDVFHAQAREFARRLYNGFDSFAASVFGGSKL